MKTLFVILFIGFFFLSLYLSFKDVNRVFPEKSITQLITDIKNNQVKKVEVIGDKIIAQYKNDQVASINKESQSSLIQTLKDSGVDPNKVTISVKDSQSSTMVVNFLSNIIPAILMIAFFIFIFRQARGAQDSIFSFGQAKTKKYSKEMSRITFAHVAGVDEAKKELEEIVDFLKNPKKYSRLGARPPKGVILVGPAGTGKTLLAKAVAGESNVPFFSIAGSEFMEMLVGIGAARARDLFTVAKKSAPSIIFIDEIDAIGRTRSVSAMPAHDEREQTLNQILVEMDGFAPNDQVIVIAATNRGDLLDPALLRPGRFDRHVILDYPDLEGRKAILQIHARGKPFTNIVSWEKLAKRTVGFSGADIENMLNEAAIATARNNRKEITNEDLEEAATKVKLGPEKKRLQSDRDKRITAYHEAGHAIVTHFQPNTDPVHRISIVSRGMSLGFTLIPPSSDRLHETKTHLQQLITSMMGGRAAEEIVFDEVTTGAANDFDQATRIAKAMVAEYGMSNLGPVNYGPTMDVKDWGRAYYEQNTISNEMLAKIDVEVRNIVEQCFTHAKKLITQNREKLNLVAEELLEKESLDDEDFIRIVGVKKPKSLQS
ncbi:cell division protein FtsH [Candidatus Roizmanbacteria bacterium RIFCSPHIGHO2_02_FULL_37_13b]|uniref:ATP-dependent zinc metalloprotease FtsH n=1 Tax=Candidatus Roizmanbacteria bacterium RIFCSPLOWO2_02_FULL_36_11 TaxID=1802071 RepID=A0A1F7JCR2_9BACT|nr:MAG: cell division protein FtsH [Candidatus Roizmanbacteria bacterium RIFCSPHIGHO2_02_FULL_37_13b]OGK53401.1 MAG: cell division protein FtsH [Candidatus Roizmanbacteria bacterium RIFCSPLOWO2_02_FULL_36_11]